MYNAHVLRAHSEYSNGSNIEGLKIELQRLLSRIVHTHLIFLHVYAGVEHSSALALCTPGTRNTHTHMYTYMNTDAHVHHTHSGTSI